jgi:chromosome segregation ATPase
MQKIVISAMLSLFVGSVIVLGVHLNRRSSDTWHSYRQMGSELSALREDLQSARSERRDLAERLDRLESSLEALAVKVQASGVPAAIPAAAAGSSAPVPAVLASPDQLKAFVYAALQEERTLRDEERQREREELRNRFEERRKELAAFREGPYERFNLKVNSLAKVLELTDAQKQSYFELSKQYQEKLQEGRQQLAGAAGEEKGKTQENRVFGRGRGEDRGRSRDLYESLQYEFTTAVQSILSPMQVETYTKLSEPARLFDSLGMVLAPGEEGGGFGRFASGFGQGAPNGQSAQGGRGRNQGGRGR